jgi:hypothetical protein
MVISFFFTPKRFEFRRIRFCFTKQCACKWKVKKAFINYKSKNFYRRIEINFYRKVSEQNSFYNEKTSHSPSFYAISTLRFSRRHFGKMTFCKFVFLRTCMKYDICWQRWPSYKWFNKAKKLIELFRFPCNDVLSDSGIESTLTKTNL